METRLLRAALSRKKGTVGLAVLALAIGASVASALLHVSGDVSRKLSHELRSLGPNLLVVPPTVADGAHDATRAWTRPPARFLDERDVRARLERAGVEGVPLLYLVARVHGAPVQVVGGDLVRLRSLHPGWSLPETPASTWMGVRLMSRLGVQPGERLVLEFAGGRRLELEVGGPLEAGGPDDEAWWIPLAAAQELSGQPGRVSLAQARVAGGTVAADNAAAAIEADGGLRALPLHALSATEAGLLERMRRLMTLVTVASLLAAGLCAFGGLTDLALERRREIALMKALGARGIDVLRQFTVEAFAIGLAGGVLGWLIGLGFAEVIGREVFHSVVTPRWDVPPVVIGLSLLVAGLASFGPARLALAVEPAAALKGD